MPISFSPALDQPTTLQLPLHPVDLTFSAIFSTPEEYRAARNSGLRVEIWSDIPQQGKPDGQWNALHFEWSSDALVLNIPSTAVIHPWKSRFSFTYRLVYPNGQIKWLGEYGRNGILAVEKKDGRFQLGSGWLVDQSSLGLVFRSTEDKLDLKIAQLTDKAEWALWVFDSESIPRLLSLDHELSNANSALLIPYQSPQGIVPFSPILLTSKDATFSVKRSGSITIHASASGALSLQNPGLTDLKSYISSSSGLEFIDCDSPYHVIILKLFPKSLGVNPACLSIISLSSSAQSPQLEFPLAHFKSNFPSEITEVALYSPSSPQVRFVSTAADTCTLTLDSRGSQWLVSPVYQVSLTDSSHVKVAVLTPHTRIITPAHAHRLPTPPPSPPLPYTQMQPLCFPEETEDDRKLVQPSTTEKERTPITLATILHATHNVGLIRMLFSLYTGLFWWLFRIVFKRLFGFTTQASTRSSVTGSGTSTPVGGRKSVATSHTSTGTVTPNTPGGFTSETVLGSPSIEQVLDEKTQAWKPDIDTQVKEQKEGEYQHPPLTLDVSGVQGPIRLVVKGHEGNVRGLKFQVDGKEGRVTASIERISGKDRDTWLVELSDASGRLTIH